MWMVWQSLEEDDLSELHTLGEVVKGLLHGLDSHLLCVRRQPLGKQTLIDHTIVFLRTMWAPALLVRPRQTLPKLPSPISLTISYLSSKAMADEEWLEPRPRVVESIAMVMVVLKRRYGRETSDGY